MIKDPNDPIDPKDKLGLPKDFGKPTNIVLPFGKRAMPPPIPPKKGPPVIEYKLNHEEVAALRAYLNNTFAHAAGVAGPFDVRLPGDDPMETEDTPLEMLKGLIKDIEAGKVKPVAMFVGMIEHKGDAAEDYPFYCTGFSRLSIRGLLHEYLENLP